MTPLYPQKLALTSPTGGGRSVGIVRSRTKATELVFFFYRSTDEDPGIQLHTKPHIMVYEGMMLHALAALSQERKKERKKEGKKERRKEKGGDTPTQYFAPTPLHINENTVHPVCYRVSYSLLVPPQNRNRPHTAPERDNFLFHNHTHFV